MVAGQEDQPVDAMAQELDPAAIATGRAVRR